VLSTIPELLPTCTLLLQSNTSEETKAVLGLLRVCVSVCSAQSLEPLVGGIIDALFNSVGPSKDRFARKIRYTAAYLKMNASVFNIR
jgi:hypothetical protein